MDDSALEKEALSELMLEAGHGALRAEVCGALAWHPSSARSIDKRFVSNTVRNVLASNRVSGSRKERALKDAHKKLFRLNASRGAASVPAKSALKTPGGGKQSGRRAPVNRPGRGDARNVIVAVGRLSSGKSAVRLKKLNAFTSVAGGSSGAAGDVDKKRVKFRSYRNNGRSDNDSESDDSRSVIGSGGDGRIGSRTDAHHNKSVSSSDVDSSVYSESKESDIEVISDGESEAVRNSKSSGRFGRCYMDDVVKNKPYKSESRKESASDCSRRRYSPVEKSHTVSRSDRNHCYMDDYRSSDSVSSSDPYERRRSRYSNDSGRSYSDNDSEYRSRRRSYSRHSRSTSHSSRGSYSNRYRRRRSDSRSRDRSYSSSRSADSKRSYYSDRSRNRKPRGYCRRRSYSRSLSKSKSSSSSGSSRSSSTRSETSHSGGASSASLLRLEALKSLKKTSLVSEKNEFSQTEYSVDGNGEDGDSSLIEISSIQPSTGTSALLPKSEAGVGGTASENEELTHECVERNSLRGIGIVTKANIRELNDSGKCLLINKGACRSGDFSRAASEKSDDSSRSSELKQSNTPGSDKINGSSESKTHRSRNNLDILPVDSKNFTISSKEIDTKRCEGESLMITPDDVDFPKSAPLTDTQNTELKHAVSSKGVSEQNCIERESVTGGSNSAAKTATGESVLKKLVDCGLNSPQRLQPTSNEERRSKCVKPSQRGIIISVVADYASNESRNTKRGGGSRDIGTRGSLNKSTELPTTKQSSQASGSSKNALPPRFVSVDPPGLDASVEDVSFLLRSAELEHVSASTKKDNSGINVDEPVKELVDTQINMEKSTDGANVGVAEDYGSDEKHMSQGTVSNFSENLDVPLDSDKSYGSKRFNNGDYSSATVTGIRESNVIEQSDMSIVRSGSEVRMGSRCLETHLDNGQLRFSADKPTGTHESRDKSGSCRTLQEKTDEPRVSIPDDDFVSDIGSKGVYESAVPFTISQSQIELSVVDAGTAKPAETDCVVGRANDVTVEEDAVRIRAQSVRDEEKGLKKSCPVLSGLDPAVNIDGGSSKSRILQCSSGSKCKMSRSSRNKHLEPHRKKDHPRTSRNRTKCSTDASEDVNDSTVAVEIETTGTSTNPLSVSKEQSVKGLASHNSPNSSVVDTFGDTSLSNQRADHQNYVKTVDSVPVCQERAVVPAELEHVPESCQTSNHEQTNSAEVHAVDEVNEEVGLQAKLICGSFPDCSKREASSGFRPDKSSLNCFIKIERYRHLYNSEHDASFSDGKHVSTIHQTSKKNGLGKTSNADCNVEYTSDKEDESNFHLPDVIYSSPLKNVADTSIESRNIQHSTREEDGSIQKNVSPTGKTPVGGSVSEKGSPISPPECSEVVHRGRFSEKRTRHSKKRLDRLTSDRCIASEHKLNKPNITYSKRIPKHGLSKVDRINDSLDEGFRVSRHRSYRPSTAENDAVSECSGLECSSADRQLDEVASSRQEKQLPVARPRRKSSPTDSSRSKLSVRSKRGKSNVKDRSSKSAKSIVSQRSRNISSSKESRRHRIVDERPLYTKGRVKRTSGERSSDVRSDRCRLGVSSKLATNDRSSSNKKRTSRARKRSRCVSSEDDAPSRTSSAVLDALSQVLSKQRSSRRKRKKSRRDADFCVDLLKKLLPALMVRSSRNTAGSRRDSDTSSSSVEYSEVSSQSGESQLASDSRGTDSGSVSEDERVDVSSASRGKRHLHSREENKSSMKTNRRRDEVSDVSEPHFDREDRLSDVTSKRRKHSVRSRHGSAERSKRDRPKQTSHRSLHRSRTNND